MDELFTAANIDNLSTFAVLAAIAIAVITDKLVWHTRLKNAEKRADRWETIALEALAVGAHAGTKAAEVAASVVSALPDPERDSSDRKA